MLLKNERIVADNGYKGSRVLTRSIVSKVGILKQIRARHESLNRKFKVFRIVGGRFRHSKDLHGVFFMAVANIVQVTLQTDAKLFKVITFEESVIFEVCRICGAKSHYAFVVLGRNTQSHRKLHIA